MLITEMVSADNDSLTQVLSSPNGLILASHFYPISLLSDNGEDILR